LFTGQVLATDPVNDLALVQLRTKKSLPVARFAKPDGIRFGQPVCAFGSPFTRTGILALGRLKGTRENGDLETATILLLPGYSGGPLLNTQGEMIGVNKAVRLSETGENTEHTAFATTITVAQKFIGQNRQKTSDMPAEAPANPTSPIAPLHDRLGAVINERSLVVQIVEPNSPAENAGITGGDRLVAVNGQRLARLEDLQTFLDRRPKNAVFTIGREAQQQELQVVF
jgi:serine protease Do